MGYIPTNERVIPTTPNPQPKPSIALATVLEHDFGGVSAPKVKGFRELDKAFRRGTLGLLNRDPRVTLGCC